MPRKSDLKAKRSIEQLLDAATDMDSAVFDRLHNPNFTPMYLLAKDELRSRLQDHGLIPRTYAEIMAKAKETSDAPKT